MNWRLSAALGSGITAFLLTSAVLTEVLAARIEFSAIVALPTGLLVGVGVAIAAATRLWDRAGARPVLLGTAASGYALCVFAAASYAVSAARGLVTVERAAVVAALVGIAVFLAVSRRPERVA